jgi:hypothetical protein
VTAFPLVYKIPQTFKTLTDVHSAIGNVLVATPAGPLA